MSFRAWQQTREINAGAGGGIQVQSRGEQGDMGMEIEVSHSEDDGLTAEAKILNLSRRSWRQVRPGEPFTIKLGWRDGPENLVFLGVIDEMDTDHDGNNDAYILRGKDESEAIIRNTSETKFWENRGIDFIVRDIASIAGLQPGVINCPSEPPALRWNISQTETLKPALDRLTREAGAFAGEAHEWYARAGELHFLPKAENTGRELGTLDTESNIFSDGIDEVDGQDEKTDGGSNLEIDAILDPRVEKDALAPVQSPDHSGVYRVSEYTLTSSSTRPGEHKMSLTAIPSDARYETTDTGPSASGAVVVR